MINGETVYVSHSRDYGSIARLRCQPGFDYISGDRDVFCGSEPPGGYVRPKIDPFSSSQPLLANTTRSANNIGLWKRYALDTYSGLPLPAQLLYCSMTSDFCPPPKTLLTEGVTESHTTDARYGILAETTLACLPGYRPIKGETKLKCGTRISGEDGGEWKLMNSTYFNQLPGEFLKCVKIQDWCPRLGGVDGVPSTLRDLEELPKVKGWVFYDNTCNPSHDGTVVANRMVFSLGGGISDAVARLGGAFCIWVKLKHSGTAGADYIWRMKSAAGAYTGWYMAETGGAAWNLEAGLQQGSTNGRVGFDYTASPGGAGPLVGGVLDPRETTSWQHLCYTWNVTSTSFYVNSGRSVLHSGNITTWVPLGATIELGPAVTAWQSARLYVGTNWWMGDARASPNAAVGALYRTDALQCKNYGQQSVNYNCTHEMYLDSICSIKCLPGFGFERAHYRCTNPADEDVDTWKLTDPAVRLAPGKWQLIVRADNETNARYISSNFTGCAAQNFCPPLTLINTKQKQTPKRMLFDHITIDCQNNHLMYGSLQPNISLTCSAYDDNGIFLDTYGAQIRTVECVDEENWCPELGRVANGYRSYPSRRYAFSPKVISSHLLHLHASFHVTVRNASLAVSRTVSRVYLMSDSVFCKLV